MDQITRSHNFHLRLSLLAVLVGLLAGGGAVVFRTMIAVVHNLAFLGEFSIHYDANTHTGAGPWGPWIIAVPVVGALLVTFIVRRWAPEARGHGVPEVIDSIYYNRSVIRPVVATAKALASSITIGTGGAVGREGPIIQIGSALGSSIGQWRKLAEWQRSTLIGGGAAAGIAATFNTPIGGLLFAVELLLPETSTRTLIPVALATGAGAFVGELVFGNVPSFDVVAASTEQIPAAGDIVALIVFGLLAGAASTLYIRSIYKAEDWFQRLPGNDYLRHAMGMFLVGAMMYAFFVHTGHYYVQGVGYATMQSILSGLLSDPWLLLLLFGAKLIATSLTLGSGGSGGVFSPALFLGATLGAAYAMLLNQALPGVVYYEPASFAMIGMAGLFGGATGAVITAIVMLFEMTRDYHVILPLLVVVSIAYGVRRHLMRDSIYTLKLQRRGHYIPDSLQSNMVMLRQVSEVFDRAIVKSADSTSLADLREITRLSGHAPHTLIVDDANRIKGVLSMERHRRLGDEDEFYIEEHLDTNYICVREDELMFDVVTRLRAAGAEMALVTRNETAETADDVLGTISLRSIAQSSSLTAHIMRRVRTGP